MWYKKIHIIKPMGHVTLPYKESGHAKATNKMPIFTSKSYENWLILCKVIEKIVASNRIFIDIKEGRFSNDIACARFHCSSSTGKQILEGVENTPPGYSR